ncbi:RTA1-like protein, partial [Mycena amicta]
FSIPDSTSQDSEYGYTPSRVVALVFLVLFAISTATHCIQAIHYRMWWLLPTACLCGIGELIGWSGRLWSSFSPDLHKAFLMQVVSLVIAPTPLIAVNFVLLSWTIVLFGPRYARLSPRAYMPLFLCADIIALLVQAAGGSIASEATTFARTQLVCLVISFFVPALSVYCVLFIEFTLRYFLDRPTRPAHPKTKESRPIARHGKNTMQVFFALGFSTVVLLVRSIYRTVQLAGGWKGRIMRTQVYFDVMDGAMVLLAIATFNFAHPGRLL